MIKILFVEDNPQDCKLVLRALEKGGLRLESFRTPTLEGLKKALIEPWDLILSDYNLPGFTALDVLEVVDQAAVDIPVIVISSALRDEAAAELMRKGARDFVRKESLERLAPAIQREISSSGNRKNQAKQVAESELQLRILASSIPQLAWMTNGKGYIYWYNQNWFEFTGTTFEQMQGWGWKSVHHPEHVDRVESKWLKHLESGEPWEDTFPLKRHSGEWRWFLSRAHPTRDESGGIINWCGTNTDITELLELRKAEEFAKQEAVRANNLKSAFLANMSHEIRTPLGAILGFTDILKNSDSNREERTKYLEIISRNGHALSKIIDDILDLSKIEAGKLEIEHSPLCLQELVREVVAMFLDRAAGKGLALNYCDAEFPNFKIDSDSIRIRQILINLIGNAIKFTNEGTVSISGEFARLEKHKVKVVIRVKDSGIGLSEAQASILFNPFSQADNQNSRRYGGTGLGLALSRKLGNALDGDVKLECSEVGKGCTFRFEFIAKESFISSDAQAVPVATSAPFSIQRLRGLNILVVDDSPDNRALMEVCLGRQGANVSTVENGQSAIDAVKLKSPDFILLDIQMPGLDGYETLKRLRQNGFAKPIAALTAHAMKEERDRALLAGFDAHIPKPIHLEEIVSVALRLTDRKDGPFLDSGLIEL